MAVTYTQHTLEKLEHLLRSVEYKVRYEKGNFKTGACLLEKHKIIVVNKFSSLESKINSLVEMLQMLDISESSLDEKQKAYLHLLKQTSLKL